MAKDKQMKKVLKHIELLGKKVKDKVTNFEGIVSSVSFELYGCVQAVVTPPMNKDGKVPDGGWYDVSRLIILDDIPVIPVPDFAELSVADGDQGADEKSVRV